MMYSNSYVPVFCSLIELLLRRSIQSSVRYSAAHPDLLKQNVSCFCPSREGKLSKNIIYKRQGVHPLPGGVLDSAQKEIWKGVG